MTTDEKLDRLTQTVAAHDRQIEALIGAATAQQQAIEGHHQQIGALIRTVEKLAETAAALQQATANLERQWQAYINTLPRT
jgi:uncharacterized coiled-coil protein SlyX